MEIQKAQRSTSKDTSRVWMALAEVVASPIVWRHWAKKNCGTKRPATDSL